MRRPHFDYEISLGSLILEGLSSMRVVLGGEYIMLDVAWRIGSCPDNYSPEIHPPLFGRRCNDNYLQGRRCNEARTLTPPPFTAAERAYRVRPELCTHPLRSTPPQKNW